MSATAQSGPAQRSSSPAARSSALGGWVAPSAKLPLSLNESAASGSGASGGGGAASGGEAGTSSVSLPTAALLAAEPRHPGRHDVAPQRKKKRIRWSSSQPPTVTSSVIVATISTPSQRIKAAGGAGGTPL
eukprot:scaffold34592_cov63-Phaeocystis_antarctica.AAC.5